MRRSTKWDLLGRNRGVVASSGNSELIILPLARMTSLIKCKLSCLIVVFTSTFTLVPELVKCAWIEVQWSNCSCRTSFSKGLAGDWQNSNTLIIILITRVYELNFVRSMSGWIGWIGLISTVISLIDYYVSVSLFREFTSEEPWRTVQPITRLKLLWGTSSRDNQLDYL